MCICAGVSVRVCVCVCTGGESQARWRRFSVARSLQLCRVLVTVRGFIYFFLLLVSQWVTIICYFIILKTVWNFYPVSLPYEWNTTGDVLNSIKLKFFLWCLVMYFQLQLLSLLFPSARVWIFLEFGKKWWLWCLWLFSRAGSSVGPLPLGFGDYWFRHMLPNIRTQFISPQTLCFGNVLMRHIEPGQRL